MILLNITDIEIKDYLKEAKALCDVSSYKAANNRAYYVIFHAINAVHALNGKGYTRHKDAVAKITLRQGFFRER